MNRKQFIQSITASSLALSFENRLQAEENSNCKPNIVLIMADDLGWQEIGVMGQKKIRTPNIDNLAIKGMRFNQFYSGSAVCAPSRCNLITGKHGGHAYIRNNREIKNKGDILITGSKSKKNPYFNIVEIINKKVKKVKNSKKKIFRRQDAPKTFDMNASIYIWNRKTLINSKYANEVLDRGVKRKTVLYEMPESRSIDIDSELDFNLVEFLLKKKINLLSNT